MEKVLLVKEFNNGYGCQCCGETWENHEWVDEAEFSRKVIVKKAIKERKDINDIHLTGLRLEKDGKTIYGFDCGVYKLGEELYWLEGKRRILLAGIREKITYNKAMKLINNRVA